MGVHDLKILSWENVLEFSQDPPCSLPVDSLSVPVVLYDPYIVFYGFNRTISRNHTIVFSLGFAIFRGIFLFSMVGTCRIWTKLGGNCSQESPGAF